MSKQTSTQILLKDLEAAKAPSFMIRKAKANEYNDYLSESAHPIIDLVRDATAYNLRDIITNAKSGKYDGTKEESDEWMKREGINILKDFR
jgi:hypothetical protein